MKAKNCLIFGGSGQIGSFLIRKLTKNNLRVTVVTRNVHQKGLKIKTQANAGYIDIVEANIKPRDSIAETLSKSSFLEIFKIMSIVYLKASGFLIKVVISLNKIPFLG